MRQTLVSLNSRPSSNKIIQLRTPDELQTDNRSSTPKQNTKSTLTSQSNGPTRHPCTNRRRHDLARAKKETTPADEKAAHAICQDNPGIYTRQNSAAAATECGSWESGGGN